jgi:serine/threonine protein kinase
MNNLKKTNKNKIGGKILGEGGFGCVISPPLKCDKNFYKSPYSIDKNYISKIVKYDKNDDDVFDELDIGNKLIKIDPNQKYFLPIINGCLLIRQKNKDLKYSKTKNKYSHNNDNSDDNSGKNSNSNSDITSYNSKKIKKCNIYLDKTYLNLISKNGGINFEKIFETKNLNLRSYVLNNYKYIIYHFCKGLSILHKNHILHSDIKSLNLMINYSKNTEKARLTFIDFGLSKTVENKSSFRYLEYLTSGGSELYKPPEIIIIDEFSSLILKSKNKQDYQKMKVFDNIIEIYSENCDFYKDLLFAKFGLEETPNNHNYYIKFADSNNINKIYNKMIDDYNNNILINKFVESEHILKWDVFSLGIFFHELITFYNIKNKNLIDLINNMIHPYYWLRYNSKDCLNHTFFTSFNSKSKSSKSKSSKSSKSK